VAHFDVKEPGNIPVGGGVALCRENPGAQRNPTTTPGVTRNRRCQPVIGHAYVHTVLDDHSRVACAEIHDNETAQTTIGVLRQAAG
jgi:Integrase core domain